MCGDKDASDLRADVEGEALLERSGTPQRAHQVKKVLAVASYGGHWIQLRRIAPAFAGHRVVYVTTLEPGAGEVEAERVHVVGHASRWNRFGLLRTAARILWIVLRERPDVVISTGAAPGFFAIVFGRLLRARTIWVDSIANGEELSLSGRKVGRYADLWMTQWEHLAAPGGPVYAGSIM